MSQDFLHNYCGKSHLIDIFIFFPDLFELFLTPAAKKVLYIKSRRGKHCVIVSSYLQSQLEKCFSNCYSWDVFTDCHSGCASSQRAKATILLTDYFLHFHFVTGALLLVTNLTYDQNLSANTKGLLFWVTLIALTHRSSKPIQKRKSKLIFLALTTKAHLSELSVISAFLQNVHGFLSLSIVHPLFDLLSAFWCRWFFSFLS